MTRAEKRNAVRGRSLAEARATIRDLRAKRRSYAAIAASLDAAGLPTGRRARWSAKIVREVASETAPPAALKVAAAPGEEPPPGMRWETGYTGRKTYRYLTPVVP